jgi:hypothetical protein
MFWYVWSLYVTGQQHPETSESLYVSRTCNHIQLYSFEREIQLCLWHWKLFFSKLRQSPVTKLYSVFIYFLRPRELLRAGIRNLMIYRCSFSKFSSQLSCPKIVMHTAVVTCIVEIWWFHFDDPATERKISWIRNSQEFILKSHIPEKPSFYISIILDDFDSSLKSQLQLSLNMSKLHKATTFGTTVSLVLKLVIFSHKYYLWGMS